MAARVSLVWLVGPYIFDTFSTFQSSPESSGVGTLSTSVAVLLFNLSNPSMSYWPLEFPAIWLSVLGVDLVFSAGTLFIATFALPHEQSMAGALFNTMIQVHSFLPTSESNQNIDESFFPFFFIKTKSLVFHLGSQWQHLCLTRLLVRHLRVRIWSSAINMRLGQVVHSVYLVFIYFVSPLFLIFLLGSYKILYDFSIGPWCSIL